MQRFMSFSAKPSSGEILKINLYLRQHNMEYLRHLRILNMREYAEWGSCSFKIVYQSSEQVGKQNFFFLNEENVANCLLLCPHRSTKKPKQQASILLKNSKYVILPLLPPIQCKPPCVFVNNWKTQLVLSNTQMSHLWECQSPVNNFLKLLSSTNWNHKSSSHSKPNHYIPLAH